MKKRIKKSTESKKTKGTKKNKSKSSRTNLWIVLTSIGICILVAILGFALYIILTAPEFETELLTNKSSTTIYDKDKKEITKIGKENREVIKYDDVPQVLLDALIATEDSRFFQHNGFDAARFVKATAGQLTGNSSSGGASTLTMQIAKNTYNGTVSRGIAGIVRKFKDIYMAVFKIEQNYTKEEIIEIYLNYQWLGNDGNINYSSINGVETACQYYFGKSVSELSLPEAALLVGMFNNPVYYNPFKYPERAETRRNTVLNLMVKHEYITEEERDIAKSIKVESLLKDTSNQKNTVYQAFIDYVIEDVIDKTGDNPSIVPMDIYTTLDTTVQSTLTDLENGNLYKFVNDKVQFGMAITSTKDGSIIALSGGRNYSAKGLNRATDINNQPGSTAKILFDYGPYIEYYNGSTYTPILDDTWTYSSGKSLKNSDNKYLGLITMRTALSKSRNIPALKIFQTMYKDDPNIIANFVHSLGIDYGSNLYEAFSIGAFNGVNPLEMSAAYSAFGRGGYYIKPYSFTKIVYTDTEKVYEHKYIKTRVMSEETAYMITNMLITAQEAKVGGNFTISGTDVAAKGGTTTIEQSKAVGLGISPYTTPDHWNITYSPDYSIAMWYGCDILSKNCYLTSSPGVNARKAMMTAVAKKVYKKNSRFTKPNGVVEVDVELETFPPQLASAYTPNDLRSTELFKRGTEPTEVSTRFSQLRNPSNGSYTYDGTTIRLAWSKILTPDAINDAYLQSIFNNYYDNKATYYYDKRVLYNSTNMGTVGYQVYLEDSAGNLISLGYTNNSVYTYTPDRLGENYKFVIKSAYSIFKNNMSNGLTINVNTAIDSNTNNMLE